MSKVLLLALALLLPVAAAAQVPQRYQVITTAPMTDVNGNAIPIGTVIDEIIWDGVTPYTPPNNTTLVPGG